jgi:hypothetical protein
MRSSAFKRESSGKVVARVVAHDMPSRYEEQSALTLEEDHPRTSGRTPAIMGCGYGGGQ